MIRHCLTPVAGLTSISVPLLPQLDSDNPLVGLICWSLPTHRQPNCNVKRDGARQLVLEFSDV